MTLPSDPLAPMDAAERALYIRGAQEFNAEEFFEAHEVWEELWRDEGSEVRRYYQGLIQVAAGFVKYGRDQPKGVVSLLRAGLDKLGPYGDSHLGIALQPLTSEVRRILVVVESHPEGTPLPPLRFPKIRPTPEAAAAGVDFAPAASPP